MPIQLVTMTVDEANPPDAIKNQRIENGHAEQASRQSSRPSWQKFSASRRRGAGGGRQCLSPGYRSIT